MRTFTCRSTFPYGGGSAPCGKIGMGLLEYQAMPSFRDLAHGGWLFTYFYYITAAGNSISSQLGSSCQGKEETYRTVLFKLLYSHMIWWRLVYLNILFLPFTRSKAVPLSLVHTVHFHLKLKKSANLFSKPNTFWPLRPCGSGGDSRLSHCASLAQVDSIEAGTQPELYNFLLNKTTTLKKGQQFSRHQPGCHLPNSPWQGLIKLFLPRESLVSDVPAGKGKTANSLTLFS